MFYELPEDLQRYIYSFDSTYRDVYNTVILELIDDIIYNAEVDTFEVDDAYNYDYYEPNVYDSYSDYDYSDSEEEESNCVWGCVGCGV